ncbi:hypothetical protein [Leuconostoc mesenteroides]|uniref:hypothetical protein n=1 Tax=Leuconostoc mesenteroides TaxID=1245 RepID=UPI000682F473|nr:hypothetical protein [Leuconostoc mesenteroides]KMY77268.1 hypothetical protein WZ79_08390 [Leuconostoc mesenteroides subsp. mesenteroides]MCT3048594.1 hypothetical protein [Leuconostoc mesenteroides]
MFLIGIVGIIMLIWFAFVGLVRLIPWLILAVIVTSIISLFLDHFVWVAIIVGAFIFFYIVGSREEKKEQKSATVDGDFEEIKK